MAPLPHHLGLLPPPCQPPFISPPTLATILAQLNLDPTHTTGRDSNLNSITPGVPTLTIYPPGYDTLSLHPDQQIHHIQTSQPNHSRPFHHKHQVNERNSSHFPLHLLLLPLFVFLLLTTIYHLSSRTYGHDEYIFIEEPEQEARGYDHQRARAKSLSDWSSLDSDDEDEKEGKKKLSGEELNERSRLLDRYNGANAYVFEEEWEVERFCKMKGYGACSEERRRLEKGLRGVGVGILVVFDD